MSYNAIEIEDVWKSYQAGSIRGQTLIRDFQSKWARWMGREDPNSKILERSSLTTASTLRNERFWAVKGVSFNVHKGEVVALLGRNGAGKSTLLQILSRITEADSGVVRLRGKVASLLGAGVGFNDEMTGRENVYLNGAILGMTPDQIAEKMEAIGDFAEIPEFLDTPVKRYSSGMKSRLGFSVAVHLDCDIMILDEVFAAGDRVFRAKCIARMAELARSGRTVLIVTHMPQLLKGVCERGIVLRNGGSVFDGDIDEAIEIYLDSSSDPKESLADDPEDMEETVDDTLVSVEQCGFVDEEGKAVHVLQSGSPVHFRFDVVFNRPVEAPVFILQLLHPEKKLIAAFKTNAQSVPVSVEAGEKVLGFLTMHDFNMIGEDVTYMFRFRVANRKPSFRVLSDHRQEFAVYEPPASRNKGCVYFRHDWKLEWDV